MAEYFPCVGVEIAPHDLKLPKAVDFVSCAQVAEFVRLLECRSIKDVAEVVVVEVDVELGQKVINDIRDTERIGVYFFICDDHLPEVLALRQDFLWCHTLIKDMMNSPEVFVFMIKDMRS